MACDKEEPLKITFDPPLIISVRTPLNRNKKSGHYVSDPEGQCWCGDTHYYIDKY